MTEHKSVVLLVDDKEENLFSLENILMELPCEIITAQSGRKALEIMQQQPIACVLLDVQMPEMNGFEVAETMKQDETLSRIPIIFVTAVELSVEKAREAYDLGAECYLTKPLDIGEVRNKVTCYCQDDSG